MDRRGFLKLFGVGVAGLALEQAIPFGRVWSFPKEIVIGKTLSVRFPPRFEIGDVISVSDFGPYIVTRVRPDELEIDLWSPVEGHGTMSGNGYFSQQVRKLAITPAAFNLDPTPRRLLGLDHC